MDSGQDTQRQKLKSSSVKTGMDDVLNDSVYDAPNDVTLCTIDTQRLCTKYPTQRQKLSWIVTPAVERETHYLDNEHRNILRIMYWLRQPKSPNDEQLGCPPQKKGLTKALYSSSVSPE